MHTAYSHLKNIFSKYLEFDSFSESILIGLISSLLDIKNFNMEEIIIHMSYKFIQALFDLENRQIFCTISWYPTIYWYCGQRGRRYFTRYLKLKMGASFTRFKRKFHHIFSKKSNKFISSIVDFIDESSFFPSRADFFILKINFS